MRATVFGVDGCGVRRRVYTLTQILPPRCGRRRAPGRFANANASVANVAVRCDATLARILPTKRALRADDFPPALFSPPRLPPASSSIVCRALNACCSPRPPPPTTILWVNVQRAPHFCNTARRVASAVWRQQPVYRNGNDASLVKAKALSGALAPGGVGRNGEGGGQNFASNMPYAGETTAAR